MAEIQIRYCDIPSFLHAGEFYRNLDSTDTEGIIKIPEDCFPLRDNLAKNLDEFRQLLRVMVFWILDDIPFGVLDYCNKHDAVTWVDSFEDISTAVVAEVRPHLLTAFSGQGFIPFEAVFQTNRFELIAFAVSKIDRNYTDLTAIAARVGCQRVLKLLHELGFVWDVDTCPYASKYGHLECLQYAHENGCPWDKTVHLRAAINGHLKCMEYANHQGLEWHVEVCEFAALEGHLVCLQFAHQNGCPWDSTTTRAAAREGHADCLRYALEHGCPVDETASNAACMYGHIDCLQLLHQYGAPWGTRSASQAAKEGQLECLQFLRETGCPWDKTTPKEAAESGHIAILRYAMEEGCPYYIKMVESATDSKDLACLQYLVEEQLLLMDEEVFKLALLKGDLACLQYLIDQGCPYLGAKYHDPYNNINHYFDWKCEFFSSEFLPCVQFAVERGWVPDASIIDFIKRCGDRPCRRWLEEEGYIENSAASSGIISVVGTVDIIPQVM